MAPPVEKAQAAGGTWDMRPRVWEKRERERGMKGWVGKWSMGAKKGLPTTSGEGVAEALRRFSEVERQSVVFFTRSHDRSFGVQAYGDVL